jgi:AhpD family alkylhydroperoxidase
MAETNYPDYYHHLQRMTSQLAKENPGTMSAFAQLRKQTMTEGALSAKMKELIALGMAITSRCEGCIAYHVHDAMRAGATRLEITETIGVAITMGGGPALIYGAEALEAVGQFEAAGRKV